MSRALVGTAFTVCLVTALVSGQAPAKVYGAATPQEVMALMDKAIKADDFGMAVTVVAPSGRTALASEGLTGLLMMIRMSNPEAPAPGQPAPSKAALDKQKKDYRALVDLVTATLKPHGMDTLVGKPPLSPETEKALNAALEKTDTVMLLASLMATMEKAGPLLGMKSDGSSKVPFKFGPVTGYKITGDNATAKAGNEPLNFVKIAGRWYLTPPKTK
jgi:hypothetical protein